MGEPMTIPEMVTIVIDAYVSQHGTSSIMSRRQLYDMVSEEYTINDSSFIPSDYCYNRTNNGIRFEGHVHLFEYLEKDSYRLLGSQYPFDGTVYHRRNGTDVAVGRMEHGQYHDLCEN